MKLLSNGSGSYRTGGAIADAVLEYGLALATNGAVDAITIPHAPSGDSVAPLTMTVGWGYPLTVTSVDAGSDIVDEPLLHSVRVRTKAQTPRGDEAIDPRALVGLDECGPV